MLRTAFSRLVVAGLIGAVVGGCGQDDGRPTKSSGETVSREREGTTSKSDASSSPFAAATGDDSRPSEPVVEVDTANQPPVKPSPVPQPIFRKSDTRPRHDDAKLAALGIRAFESNRLKLYTDIDPKLAAKLPPLIDAAYTAWEAYFGKLPANRERTNFQVTGYLMADKGRFRDAGLIPGNLRPFVNGRHRGAEFWMNDQKYDYYRSHLVIHESTHCFMEAIAGERYYEGLPAWYWEGMAELFGTHQTDTQGKVHFRVMPDDRENFAGLGRVTLVREAVDAGKRKSIGGVTRLRGGDFIGNDAYAWSWALCKFLDTHPAYQKRFHEFGRLLTGSRFKRAWREFGIDLQGPMVAEWTLFVNNLQYGYDIERAAIDFRPGKQVAGDAALNKANIRADRGWQSAVLRVEKGTKYVITASGQFTLAQQPKPWISEAGGISFDYFGGRPLGLLLAAIHSDGQEILPEFAVGRQHEFVAPASGTLYFRLNDSWSRLTDNTGQVNVGVQLGNQ
ncbi:MAG: hypothetical protein HOK71_01240 [Planctomycetaceae bacterium]|jgi:hypothetical protein|nr:hypothetical protein [Planctomycetaceae bacterium]MBT6483281.1 hypothetical protein [Planctomycetaceae bacterium]